METIIQSNPASLVGFLQSRDNYNVQNALETCEKFAETCQDPIAKNHINKGIVYLLGRLGQTSEALDVIVKIGDVNLAINFIQQDEELWDELIKKSLSNPFMVSGLLDYNPIPLLAHIPLGMEIPGLKNKLIKCLTDLSLQVVLYRNCLTIIKAHDCVLSEELYNRQRRGVKVSKVTCLLCGNSTQEDYVVFSCSHVFHPSCLKVSKTCPICHQI